MSPVVTARRTVTPHRPTIVREAVGVDPGIGPRGTQRLHGEAEDQRQGLFKLSLPQRSAGPSAELGQRIATNIGTIGRYSLL